MNDVGRTPNLVRRNGTYYCRVRCPKHLLRPGIPVEQSRSLDTKERSVAVERIADARAQIMAFFRDETPRVTQSAIRPARVRRERPSHPDLPFLTRAEVEPLARRFFDLQREGLELGSAELVAMDRQRATDYRLELQGRLNALDNPHEDDPDVTVDAEIALLHEAGRRSPYGSEVSRLLRFYIHRAMRQLLLVEIARGDGDYRDQISDSLFAPASRTASAPQSSEPILPSVEALPFSKLIEAWSRERKVAPKTLAAHEAVARWFIERIGVDDVGAVTARNVRDFKDKLVAEDTSAPNIRTKLQRLHTLFQYALDNGDIPENPAKGVQVKDKDAARRKRKEFDLTALEALFSSPIYSQDVRPTQGRGEAAYWLPLIALYTGARLEEIAQLRPSDIKRERYLDGNDNPAEAWVICVVNDPDEGMTTKNANSERRIPLHPALEALGLVRYATDATARKDRLLFPALKPNLYGKLGAKWGEWWSTYRRDVCGITDRLVVFHSFRHTFKGFARHVGMVEGVQRQIMGHSPSDTADEYGSSRYSLHQLVEGMKLYRVPGLKLPPAPPRYRGA